MSQFLDVRIFAVAASAAALVVFFILLDIYLRNITYNGFWCWTTASLFSFFGTLLLGLRYYVPDFLSIVLSNSFIAMTYMLIAFGMSRFAGVRWKEGHLLLIPALLQLPAILYFTYTENNADARIIVISSVAAFYLFVSLYVSIRHLPNVLGAVNATIIVILGLSAIGAVARVAYTIVANSDTSDFMQYPPFDTFIFLVLLILTFAVFIETIILNAQRVEYDLHKSHEEIQTLRGLLPICSFCKKIKDSDGYWNQLEEYISEHSEATFTHGICDECAQKNYPELRNERNK